MWLCAAGGEGGDAAQRQELPLSLIQLLHQDRQGETLLASRCRPGNRSAVLL
jgi:hypothetical protein